MDKRDPEEVTTNERTIGGVPPPETPPLLAKPREDLSQLPTGTEVGRYVLKKVIGKGGMGVVYVAYDPDLNRRIAIKILNSGKVSTGFGDSISIRNRLLREAQAMASVTHPNMVQVYDVGTFRGSVFIAMEFVSGRTLREWRAEIGPGDWREILSVYRAAGLALSASHDSGLIHRDFKPDNVMLGFDGRARVMDFGLARSVEKRPVDSMSMNSSDILDQKLTETNMVLGTPAYMAPEQFLGEAPDHRTDQFAFCVSLYEQLYGYRPFTGKNMAEIAKAVMKGRIRLPPRESPVPDYVSDVLIRGLQCSPDDRWNSMPELIEGLSENPKREFFPPWMVYVITGVVAAFGLGMYIYSAGQIRDHKALPPPVEEASPKKVSPAGLKQMLEESRSGILTTEQIEDVIKDNWNEVQVCYSRGLKKYPGLSGEVALRFYLDINGEVELVTLERNTLYDKSVGRCLLGLSMTWRYPVPVNGAAAITYRLALGPEREAPI